MMNRRLSSLSIFFCSLIVLMLGSTSKTHAQDISADFKAANALYEKQDFAGAAAAFDKIASAGKVSAPLLFNLGNAHYQTGEFGKAIAAYRRAQLLAPRDADIRVNLRFAREKVPNSGATPPEEGVLSRLSVNEWTLLATVPFAICFLLLAFGQVRRDWQKPVRLYASVLAVVSLILVVMAAVAARSHSNRSAVVVAEEAVVRHGPFNESQSAFTLRNGAELSVLDERETWVQVSAGANRSGWLRKEQLAIFN